MAQYILPENNGKITLVTKNNNGTTTLTFGHYEPRWYSFTHDTRRYEENYYTYLANERKNAREMLNETRIQKDMEQSIEQMIDENVCKTIRNIFQT